MRQPSSFSPSQARGSGSLRTLPACSARALVLWPGLDRARLVRTGGDPARIANLVTRRTSLPPEDVIELITRTPRHLS